MMNDKLQALAARVEEMPTRAVDAEIWEALDLVPGDHCRLWCRMDGRTDLTRAMFILAWSPLYTSSLDAAMTLLPEGWEPRRVTWFTNCVEASLHAGFASATGRAPTPAQALTAACLRAHASVQIFIENDQSQNSDSERVGTITTETPNVPHETAEMQGKRLERVKGIEPSS